MQPYLPLTAYTDNQCETRYIPIGIFYSSYTAQFTSVEQVAHMICNTCSIFTDALSVLEPFKIKEFPQLRNVLWNVTAKKKKTEPYSRGCYTVMQYSDKKKNRNA